MNTSETEYRIPEKMSIETEDYKNSNDEIGRWIREELIPCDNVTEFNELYEESCDWYNDLTGNGKFDRKSVRDRLLDWQCNQSGYGFVEGGINGTKTKPKFNLISKN